MYVYGRLGVIRADQTSMCLDQHPDWNRDWCGLNWFRHSDGVYLLTVPRRCFFCGSLVSVLFCCAFMNVCLRMPCGYLLGKG